jgi:hypothetical protein
MVPRSEGHQPLAANHPSLRPTKVNAAGLLAPWTKQAMSQQYSAYAFRQSSSAKASQLHRPEASPRQHVMYPP